jgi:hypothetical protein
MARVYADVNANMPRSYWDYDSVNISWGVLENYEVVRKIGMFPPPSPRPPSILGCCVYLRIWSLANEGVPIRWHVRMDG